jgi:hypothetical protein
VRSKGYLVAGAGHRFRWRAGRQPAADDVGALKKVAFEEPFDIEITTSSTRPDGMVAIAVMCRDQGLVLDDQISGCLRW